MAKKIFLRRDSTRFSKFGRKRKKILGWRKPKGRDNKMREKRKGYSKVVSIGYSANKSKKGKLKNKIKIEIKNINDLNKLNKENIGVVGGIGKNMKIKIANAAKDMKVELFNLNPISFLKNLEKKQRNNKKEDKKGENKK